MNTATASSVGEWMTRGTIWLALICYFVSAGLRLRSNSNSLSVARGIWMFGAIAAAAHLVAAFSFHHDWSHSAALAETARQTEAVTGLKWGGGLYFNYAFVVIWLADAIWWWRDAEGYLQRSRWLEALVQLWFVFMFFNGAVVFASGAVRWFALAGFGVLTLLAARRRSRVLREETR